MLCDVNELGAGWEFDDTVCLWFSLDPGPIQSVNLKLALIVAFESPHLFYHFRSECVMHAFNDSTSNGSRFVFSGRSLILLRSSASAWPRFCEIYSSVQGAEKLNLCPVVTSLKMYHTISLGLKSRFDLINFDDFDEDEIKTIWKGEMEKRRFECDDRVTSVVARRLARQAGRKGFGNARAVRKEVLAQFSKHHCKVWNSVHPWCQYVLKQLFKQKNEK